ncbi:Dipeptidyl aminopeptidase/acylaminoacyl peptidase [Pseudonocardia ammonioxydans]|uniref:Dipeptidyl aminopeptidase/acylaminoacyl peptidase n=1 Tax=Pseudonocardia ammonioxydans TaxID=260086 RepID=A0A1I5AIP0_PSUAM|nr:prolyl oligopeptidase family serine peptidase [Pseudonocardia ammonioxydans]SFN62305.1 Dipeptidyl aminopeptidase/acylaminoacyl peptidase [Pseudonocardia ammonioxydans]
MPTDDAAKTPFHDLDAYVALPRLGGLALSPDGTRLVTGVAEPEPDGTRHRTALWEVDPTGRAPARRLTRGAAGESGPVFTPDGDLLFRSARPDPDASSDTDPPAGLWLLPAAGGEARPAGSRPGGVDDVAVGRGSGTVVASSPTLPGAVTGEDDERRRTARSDAKVTAILHTGYPVRHWDHDLGPAENRLLVRDGEDWTDLTPAPGRALDETAFDVSPDGATVVTGWNRAYGHGSRRPGVVAIDVAGGEHRDLLFDDGHEYGDPRISPDGHTVVVARERLSTPDLAPRVDLVLVPLTGGEPRPVAPGWDRWPSAARWTADSAALIVTADEDGRGPLFRIDLDPTGDPDGDRVVRLTADHGCYTEPVPSPDGHWIYALRNAYDAAPAPVRVDARAGGTDPEFLPGPAEAPELPGTLTEIETTAADGTRVRAWLVLPAGAGPDDPAPLLLWIHGGPLNSWNAWSWRWNPWLMAARGYAVLLPDPGLSTGYGQEFVQRGWGRWGGPPYEDLMAITDAAVARPDIDAGRTAAMGGSFGGYMANWVAGHTDRFAAIVTHASLWALDQFGPTTDHAHYWLTEMTPEMAQANSPHHHADAIRTPMLVIHGDKDYRVPIGDGLRLWWDLVSRQPDPAANPHRFLYFPDENHWVLAPNHAKLWYETVYAFLATHVLGEEWTTPDLLQ